MNSGFSYAGLIFLLMLMIPRIFKTDQVLKATGV